MQCLDHCEAQHLFEVVFPAMVDLALRAPTLCTMVSATDLVLLCPPYPSAASSTWSVQSGRWEESILKM